MDAVSEIAEVKLNGDYTEACQLYRNSHQQFVNADGKPKASAFSPKDGMSSDWNKFSSVEDSLIRVGLTKKPNGDFKDSSQFRLFSLSISDIKVIKGVSSIDYTPILNEPEIIGKPNNPSHTDIWFMDEELRIKFASIATPLSVDMEEVILEIQKRLKEYTS